MAQKEPRVRTPQRTAAPTRQRRSKLSAQVPCRFPRLPSQVTLSIGWEASSDVSSRKKLVGG